MNDKFQHGLKLVREIEQEILVFESSELRQHNNNIETPINFNEKLKSIDNLNESIMKTINSLNALITDMRKKIEIKDESKGIWEIKIENLDFKARGLLKELKKAYKLKKENLNEEKEKYELMGVRFSCNSNDNNGVSILIKEQESIKNSLSNTSEMISIGRNIMSSLKFQGDSLKKIQKKVYTLLNEVGLSNTMTKLIERRSKNDMYIMCFCFIILFITIFVLYFYVRPMIKGN